jgi:hypothetical protein
VELDPKARAAAGRFFPNEWTSATISQAPAAVRDLAQRTGGLRASQSIFAGAAIGSTYPYGLWWPWEDAVTISARIGLDGPYVTPMALQRLRETLGIEL